MKVAIITSVSVLGITGQALGTVIGVLNPETPITISILVQMAGIAGWTIAGATFLKAQLRNFKTDIQRSSRRDMRTLVYVLWSTKAQRRLVEELEKRNPNLNTASVDQIMAEVETEVMKDLETQWKWQD